MQPTPEQVSEIRRLMGEARSIMNRNKDLLPEETFAVQEAIEKIRSWGFKSLNEFWLAVPDDQKRFVELAGMW